MANMLRDWLGPLAEQELEGALRWKDAEASRDDKSRSKDWKNGGFDHNSDDDELDDDMDLKYTASGDDLSISVTRPVAGENSYVQIVQFKTFESPFTVLLADGHTEFNAFLGGDAVKRFQTRHQRRVTEGTQGGMIALRSFDISINSKAKPEDRIHLHVHDFAYRKGSGGTGTVGHASTFCSRPNVKSFLTWLQKPVSNDSGKTNPPAAKPPPVPVSTDVGFASQALPQEPVDDDCVMLDAPLPSRSSFQSQDVMDTQAPIPGLPSRKVKKDQDVMLMQGTNLRGPVYASMKPGLIDRRSAIQVTKNAAELFALLQQHGPQPKANNHAQVQQPVTKSEPQSWTPSSPQVSAEMPDADNYKEFKVEDARETIFIDSSREEEPTPDTSGLVAIMNGSVASKVKPFVTVEDSTTGSAPESLEPEKGVPPEQSHTAETTDVAQNPPPVTVHKVRHRQPDPKYIQYARRRIPRDQRELLERSESWFPGPRFPPANVPVAVLQKLGSRPATIQHVPNSGSSPAASTSVVQGLDQVMGEADTNQKDDSNHLPISTASTVEEEFRSSQVIEWSSSPPREAPIKFRFKNDLPPDSSAEEERNSQHGAPVSSAPPSPMSLSDTPMDLDNDSDDSAMEQAVPRQLVNKPRAAPKCIYSPQVQVQKTPSVALHSSGQPSGATPRAEVGIAAALPQAAIPTVTPASRDTEQSRIDDTLRRSGSKRPVAPEAEESRPVKKPSRFDWSDDDMPMEDPAVVHARNKSEHFRKARLVRQSRKTTPKKEQSAFAEPMKTTPKKEHVEPKNTTPKQARPAIVDLTKPSTPAPRIAISSTAPVSLSNIRNNFGIFKTPIAKLPVLAPDSGRHSSVSSRGTPVKSIEGPSREPSIAPRPFSPSEYGIGRASGLANTSRQLQRVDRPDGAATRMKAVADGASPPRRQLKMSSISEQHTVFNDYARNYSRLKVMGTGQRGTADAGPSGHIDVLGWKL